MKSVTRYIFSVIGCLLLLQLHYQADAYFESEQIEQKYESIDEGEPMQALSNVQSTSQIQQQQQPQTEQQSIVDTSANVEQLANIQHQQTQSSSLTISTSDQNRLNEIYNRLATQSQVMPKNFQDDAQTAASSYSSLSSSNEESQPSSDYGMYQNNEGLSKITQIPQGSMFAFPDKHGKLEFESMYAKQPYSIVFRTQSMPVKIKQQHQTLPAPEVEFVRSQEEAHRIKHEVIRPVIQEVHEIIQPYRRVVQEVRPVIENVHTIVAKGEPRGASGGNRGGGGQGADAYADNIRGSYSEKVRFITVPDHHQQLRSQQYHPQARNFHSIAELRPKAARYLQRRF